MNKKTKMTIIIAATAVAIAVAAAVIVAAKSVSKKSSEDTSSTAQTSEIKEYTPTFMYFISNSDNDFEATASMIEELKKEYEGRVNFDIINIDEVPEAKDNFPVDQQTPALIMLNTENNISAIEFKCSDKKKLSQYIDAALN